ncbi:MAG: glycosyltransferase family 4 protein [Bacteroidetes bacterium]|nr:glycosyltransferase family 4 protein [Bacteroidota bacterium]MBP6426280.1 glycosyltransferase family 4 protein [Bacteroidia bacterium]MBP6656724.1 glycosyltransferase family 4 protein [Bacteroidia bacterium]
MRIAVNTRMLLKGKMEGIGYFTYETMKRMVKNHPEHQFIFMFDRPFDESFVFSENVEPVVVSPPARHPLLWYWWYEHSLPSAFKKSKADLFIGTDGYLSVSSKVKTLSVFHDINFEHYPEDLPVFNRLFYKHYFPIYARNAARIAAVSGFTKNDVIEKYNIDPGKIDIVYNGVSDQFKQLSAAEILDIRNKFTQGQPYFLFVGSLHQRKNISNMLNAFDEFKKSKSLPVKMVLAGAKRWWTDEMETTLQKMENKQDVIFTGRVSFEELCRITAGALAMTYVSTFEGFGIPIVEAMRSGVPVITSNVTSMPEIAGNAALLCDPFSVQSISGAMIRIASDDQLRIKLIDAGLKRQADFSWDKTAKQLWESVEKTIELI